MTYLRALSDHYGSWRSQAYGYFIVFVLGTNFAVALEIKGGIPPLQVLLLTCLVTGGLILVLPLFHSVFIGFDILRDLDTHDKTLHDEGSTHYRRASKEVVRKSKWAEEYADYLEQAQQVISQVQRADISPQTKMVLLRLLYLLEIDQSRMPVDDERRFFYNEGTYNALIPIYRELEEILLSVGIQSYGGIQKRTKQEQPNTQEQPKT